MVAQYNLDYLDAVLVKNKNKNKYSLDTLGLKYYNQLF